MATLLGRTTAGTTADFFGTETGAWKFTASGSGDVAKLGFQTKVANATLATVTLAIYADDAGGADPGTRLGFVTVSTGITGTGAFTGTLSPAVTVASGTAYWLAVSATGEQFDWQGDSGGSYVVDFAANPSAWSRDDTGNRNAIIWGEDAGSAGATVTAVPADATGAAPAPTASAGSTVTSPVADAAGDGPDALATASAGTADFSTYPNGPLTAPWVTGNVMPDVDTGAVTGFGADAIYPVAAAGADSQAQATFGHALLSGEGYGVHTRMTSLDASSGGYEAFAVRGGGATITVGIYTLPDVTPLDEVTGFSNVDGIRLVTVGSLIRADVRQGGVWSQATSVTDTTYTSAGYPGLYVNQGGLNAPALATFTWGAASASPDATVTAAPADATGSAPAPTLTAGSNVTAPPADATGASPAPIPSAGSTVTSVPADGTGTAPAPTLSAGSTVTAPPADGTGTAPPANQIVSAEVTTGPASATGAAPAPTVSGSGAVDATVTAVPADATGDTPNPTVTAGANVTSPAADAVGSSPAPTVTGTAAGEVAAPPADAAGSAPSPAVTAAATVTAPPADAAGTAPAPTVTGTAAGEVAPPPARGTGTAPAPAVTADANVVAPPADATADAPDPAPTGDGAAIVTAPAADATGDAPAPTLNTPPPSVTGRVNPRRLRNGRVSRTAADDRPLILRR